MSENFIHIDVSELPAPEPLEKVLALLTKLEEAEKDRIICMSHRHEPCALFNILKERNYDFLVDSKLDKIQIFIWHNSNLNAPIIVQKAILDVR